MKDGLLLLKFSHIYLPFYSSAFIKSTAHDFSETFHMLIHFQFRQYILCWMSGIHISMVKAQFSNISHLEKFGLKTKLFVEKCLCYLTKPVLHLTALSCWYLHGQSLQRLSGGKQRRECVSMSQFSTDPHIVCVSGSFAVNIFVGFLAFAAIHYIRIIIKYVQ